MARVRPGEAGEAGRREDASWSQARKRSYLLAFAVIVAIKILAVIWFLGSAGPALLQGSGG